MELKCTELTRGSGKIYLRIEWEGAQTSEHYVAHVRSATRKGMPFPATVLPVPHERAFVVVLAVLRVSQYVSLELVDERGVSLGAVEKRVPPLTAKLTSQFNTLRKNAEAEAIRNYDEGSQRNGIYVSFGDFIFHDKDNMDVVYGTVDVLTTSSEELGASVTLRFYGASGSLLDNGAWTNMGETRSKSKEHPGAFVHQVGFSVRVSKALSYLACWVLVGDEADPQRSAIACLRPFEIRGRRAYWNGSSECAQYTPKYDEWFRTKHRTTVFDLGLQRAHSFAIEPLFSIVVPVYKTPHDFFCQMADSVLSQTYGKFELILVDASPEDAGLCTLIEEYAQRDKRVRVVRMSENLGIVGNTYAGVAHATGDFISFFDHDDVLEPDLLYRYVEGINAYPTTDLLYCDEDKLQGGNYISPYFKPDWNPDLLCSNNYVCHLLTVRKSIVDELGKDGLERFEGSQDHHLTLFAGERARNVYHARKVLYHWRIHEQSTAGEAQSKSYTEDAGVRAVQAHLDRCGIHAQARPSGVAPNTYHVDYELESEPLVSIVIPNKDMVPLLDRCLASIRNKSTYGNYELLIVENNSVEQATFEYYEQAKKQDSRVRVVVQPSDGSFNFSKTINFGVRHAKGDYLLFLNNDTEVMAPNWIERLLGPLQQRDDIGAVGAKLLYPNGLVQHAGVMIHGMNGPFHVAQFMPSNTLHQYCVVQLASDYSAVTGACMLTRRSLFDQIGGLDESLAVDYNDIDFCLKVRKRGLLVFYEPEALLMHYESISRGEHRSDEQMIGWSRDTGIMMGRWSCYYGAGDPYCNPNLEVSAYHKLKMR